MDVGERLQVRVSVRLDWLRDAKDFVSESRVGVGVVDRDTVTRKDSVEVGV